MNPLRCKAMAAVSHIRSQTEHLPEIAILTGTGLGECTDDMIIDTQIEFKDIPFFPMATVEGHPGCLACGSLNGRPVMVFKGRFHLYEGYTPEDVVFPVRVMQELGIRRFIVSNASGGIDSRFSPGDIMLIRDHINLTGRNPLVGLHNPSWGDRFPDMAFAYHPELVQKAQDIGSRLNLPIQTGVYAGLLGPSLETPSEIRFLRSIGASAVGFSTVMEVIAAVQAGMRIVGLSIVTNVHDPDNPKPASLDAILEVARSASPALQRLIGEIVLVM